MSRADELLALVNAKQGHFVYESGHHGNLWLEMDALFLRPASLHPFVTQLAEQIVPHDVELVCGPATGGAWLALLLAGEMDCEFVEIERAVNDAGAQ